MKRIAAVVAGSVLALVTGVQALGVSDVIEWNSGYFVPSAGETYNSPYYRWYNEDWGWQHSVIGGTFTTASLSISAFDVDAGAATSAEWDEIWVKDDGSWVSLGYLAGANNIYSYTTFNLGAGLFDDIANGLEVWIDIDKYSTSRRWAVTLAKSVLSLDGGFIPDPNPNPQVPEPMSLAMIAVGLVAVAGYRRRRA